MSDKQNESRGDFSATGPDDQVVADRVQELTWALLDEQINDDEFILLDNLLLADDKARNTYLGCTQLHADLMAHFAVPSANTISKADGGSQILGLLNTESPSIGFHSPSAGKAT